MVFEEGPTAADCQLFVFKNPRAVFEEEPTAADCHLFVFKNGLAFFIEELVDAKDDIVLWEKRVLVFKNWQAVFGNRGGSSRLG